MSTVISCIMPVYNAAAYLEDAIKSVTAQSWPYFELLLIDDGSTDGSDKICDEAAQKDCRIQVVHQANSGVSSARNVGLSIASGRILCFVDADDRLKPGAFARIIPAFEDRGRDLVSFGLDQCKNSSQESAFHISFSCEKWDDFWPHFVSYFDSGLFQGLCNKAYRADLIRSSGLCFDKSLRRGEDVSFNLSYWSLISSFEHIEDSLYEYWARPDSLTQAAVLDSMDNSCKMLHNVKNFLCQHGQQQLYPLLVAAQLPWRAARFFDTLLDASQPFTPAQRQQALDRLFADEMWHASLLTELVKRSGTKNTAIRWAAAKKQSRILLSLAGLSREK